MFCSYLHRVAASDMTNSFVYTCMSGVCINGEQKNESFERI